MLAFRFAFLVGIVMLFSTAGAASAEEAVSHPRLRPAPKPSTRPVAAGPARYVDAVGGDDSHDGSEPRPWRSIRHAMDQLRAGETLYLRKGTYREQVDVSISGRADAPITIRAYPGELATIDGGFAEFFDAPGEAWEPAPGGVAGEFRSKRPYPNRRDIIGAFGDSMIGLQTYWHQTDLQARSELWDEVDGGDVQPVYCGPGVYYDASTGHIHARLAPTHLPTGFVNYQGETDPRKLPLVLAPFRSIPLHVDQASHVRFQDLVIRGGGYDTVVLENGEDIEFDNVTVYCGTYGMRTNNVIGLRFLRSALYGNTPPWGFRVENSLRNREGRGKRDIARLAGHALWVADTGLEWSIYAYPLNDQFEIAYSTFTDCHDGLYLGGINVKFHHNVVEDMQDDGMYISPVYNRGSGEQHIYQNVFRRVLTVFACGGPLTDVSNNSVFIYRNVIDLREPIRFGRPSTKKPVPTPAYGNVMGDHGGPPWPAMNVYHNTVISAAARTSSQGIFGGMKQTPAPRRVLNNALVTVGKLPAYQPLNDPNSLEAGNLYWGAGPAANDADAYFAKYRQSADYKKSAEANKIGSSAKSIVADPKFVSADDPRPQPGSPLVNSGFAVPTELPDPMRSQDAGAPDIGAFPLNAPPLIAGKP